MKTVSYPITISDMTLNHIANEALQLAQDLGLFTPQSTNTQDKTCLFGTDIPPINDGPGGNW